MQAIVVMAKQALLVQAVFAMHDIYAMYAICALDAMYAMHFYIRFTGFIRCTCHILARKEASCMTPFFGKRFHGKFEVIPSKFHEKVAMPSPRSCPAKPSN